MPNHAKRSAWVSVTIYLFVFLFVLILNGLSPYIADDFRYLYSFNDFERIESIPQVITSMRAHRYNMNGRLVAHTLVQVLGMLPMWFFDILNAAMLVLQGALLHKIARGRSPRSNKVLMSIFCCIWLFCPAFGQVNLWQDGAVNYLWSAVFALLYLMPFIEEYLYGKAIETGFGKFCFLCLSFGMGAYSETVSAAAIGMSILLVFLLLVFRRHRLKPLWLIAIIIATLGYLSIYTAPAQWREKSAEMTFPVLLNNFLSVAAQYWQLLGVLLVIFAVALVLNLLVRTDSRRVLLALVFLAGSLAANFIMMFASYYTDRSAVGAFVFLLAADAVLIYPLLGCGKFRLWLVVGFLALCTAMGPALYLGVTDICDTYTHLTQNEAYILQCREQGILEIEVPLFTASTKYSEAFGSVYLNTDDPNSWPNDAMIKYYAVHSLLGVDIG